VILPLAALGIGILVDRFGAPFVLQGMGALTLVSVAVLLLAYRPLRRLDIDLTGAAQMRTRPFIR
jgi:hypothetical protein